MQGQLRDTFSSLNLKHKLVRGKGYKAVCASLSILFSQTTPRRLHNFTRKENFTHFTLTQANSARPPWPKSSMTATTSPHSHQAAIHSLKPSSSTQLKRSKLQVRLIHCLRSWLNSVKAQAVCQHSRGERVSRTRSAEHWNFCSGRD